MDEPFYEDEPEEEYWDEYSPFPMHVYAKRKNKVILMSLGSFERIT